MKRSRTRRSGSPWRDAGWCLPANGNTPTPWNRAGLLVRLGIWRKPDGAPQFSGDRPGMGSEAVAIRHKNGRKRWNGGGKHAFWEYARGENYGHPAAKPLPLMMAFVRDFTEPGESVLDPFMGTGTAGVACVRLGRRFTGIEIEPAYFRIACKRIEQAYAQPELFPACGRVTQGELFAAQGLRSACATDN